MTDAPFRSNNSLLGTFWFLMVCLSSSLNDILMKFLGDRLNFVEISFFRFLFSLIVIFIPILISKQNLLRTYMHRMHIVRGALGAIAIGLCCLGIILLPLAESSTILFTEALFTLPLAVIFLHEKLSRKIIISCIIGFIGLIIMFKPSAANLNIYAFIPTAAAILFAVMNIMIKKMVNHKEHNITMLFYFSLYTTVISAFFVPFFWITPTVKELVLLFLLGIGSHLIQLFLFLAYRSAEASKMASVRYVELVITATLAYLFFDQVPDNIAILGCLLIIIGTFIVSYPTNSKKS